MECRVIKESHLLTFIDARGHPASDFLPQFSKEIGAKDPVILICHSGVRSAALAEHLTEKMGYTTVYNHRHGISRWISEKNPVVRPK